MKPIASRARGVSLIEVLVAVAVLSIGLLGVAGLQLRAIKTADAAFQRTVANIQAQDLVERYWAGVCSMPNVTQRRAIEDIWRASHQDNPTLPQWTANVAAILNVTSEELNFFQLNISWVDRGANPTDTARTTFQYRFIAPLAECDPDAG